jgi:hypothetical protein
MPPHPAPPPLPLQMVLLLGSAGWSASLWGVAPASPLHGPAMDFLIYRSIGAPATVMLLVLQVSG